MESPPSRGAWIEILCHKCVTHGLFRRPPRGGRGLKSYTRMVGIDTLKSPPSRGAWIEILDFWERKQLKHVAPLAGGVD